MNCRRKWLNCAAAVLAALALAQLAAHAADGPRQENPTRTLYVDAVAGDDASPQGPWRTVQHAADACKAGDLIVVRKGQYAGFVLGWDSPQNGTAGAPITFKADPGAVIASRNSKTADGIDLESASYIIIDGFSIDNAGGSITRAGVRSTKNSHVIIRNLTADHCGTWGIFTSFSEKVTIENNVTSNSKSQHGIYVSNSADDPVIRGNRVFGNHMCGIHINGDLSQGGDGIISRALVENNIVYDNGVAGGSAINCDGVQDSRFQNNLLYDNHANGISLFRDDGAAGSNNNLVVNNTIIMAGKSRWAINIKDKSTGNIVYNNILINLNPAHGAINIATDSLPGFSSDHNAVDGRFSPDDDNVVKLGAWQSQTGMDKHSFVATLDKLFLDVRQNDYHLADGSPAIGAGASLPAPHDAPARDLEARPRLRGKWDLGAYAAGHPASVPAVQGVRNGLGPWSIAAPVIAMLALGLGGWFFRNRGLHRWIVPYCLAVGRRTPPRPGEEIHLMLCIADHFEPKNGGVSDRQAMARLQRWGEDYPELFAGFRDSDGRPPRHTFFYPIEQYQSEQVEAIAALCRQGYGEIEIHLHHDNDTSENLCRRLEGAKRLLASHHHALAHHHRSGELAYAFVHGDWALDNSRPDGRCCGVNNELDILRETGCYADLTLPSAPSPTQTSRINSIYYAVDDPARPMSHNHGIDVGRGGQPPRSLMLIQGPLLLNWKRRKWGLMPRIENGCLHGNNPASQERIDLWLRARVQVASRPDWFFVKLHAHGANEDGQRALLGRAMQQFHRDLAARARAQPHFHFHYVTARELYNLVRAAEAGWKGTVEAARDFELHSNFALLQGRKTA